MNSWFRVGRRGQAYADGLPEVTAFTLPWIGQRESTSWGSSNRYGAVGFGSGVCTKYQFRSRRLALAPSAFSFKQGRKAESLKKDLPLLPPRFV